MRRSSWLKNRNVTPRVNVDPLEPRLLMHGWIGKADGDYPLPFEQTTLLLPRQPDRQQPAGAMTARGLKSAKPRRQPRKTKAGTTTASGTSAVTASARRRRHELGQLQQRPRHPGL